jgi:hypothetical protein
VPRRRRCSAGNAIAKKRSGSLGALIPTGSASEDRRTFYRTIQEQNSASKIAETRMDIGSSTWARISDLRIRNPLVVAVRRNSVVVRHAVDAMPVNYLPELLWDAASVNVQATVRRTATIAFGRRKST